jgi:hypothetical protein
MVRIIGTDALILFPIVVPLLAKVTPPLFATVKPVIEGGLVHLQYQFAVPIVGSSLSTIIPSISIYGKF